MARMLQNCQINKHIGNKFEQGLDCRSVNQSQHRVHMTGRMNDQTENWHLGAYRVKLSYQKVTFTDLGKQEVKRSVNR
jgi:hypothetical protein